MSDQKPSADALQANATLQASKYCDVCSSPLNPKDENGVPAGCDFGGVPDCQYSPNTLTLE